VIVGRDFIGSNGAHAGNTNIANNDTKNNAATGKPRVDRLNELFDERLRENLFDERLRENLSRLVS